ncbi:MAG: hypothetical protein HFG30_06335 [Eubacterium sp.]|nr:hypothetical protein [Eubacterium sp.]
MNEYISSGYRPGGYKKIDELAKKKGISRNEYLKNQISKIAVMKETEEVEDKYSNLVNVIVDRLEQSNDVIRENSVLLEKIRGE